MIRSLLAAALVAGTATFAFGADVQFPLGARVGITPAAGLAIAKSFSGFETQDDAVKVLIAELPAAAYAEVEATLKANPAGSGPVKPETLPIAGGTAFYTMESATVGSDAVRRYSMILPGSTFSGYVAVQVAQSADAKYPVDAIKAMLASAVVRETVPVEEQLGMLPFKVSELSGFKTVRTLAPGAAILLGDASGDLEANVEAAPFMIIGTIGGVPEKADDRSRFAQQAAAQIPGLRDGKFTVSEPMRIDGSPGFETRIDAVSGKDNTPVTVVQWLRFGGNSGALRIIASAPRDQWSEAFTRFRAVRDGIESR